MISTPLDSRGTFPYTNSTFDPDTSPSTRIPFTRMKISITVANTGAVISNSSTWIAVNSTDNEILIPMEGLVGKGEGDENRVQLSILGTSPDAIQSFSTVATVRVLSEDAGLYNGTAVTAKTTKARATTVTSRFTLGGTQARIDRSHDQPSLQVRSPATNNTWTPFFPIICQISWENVTSILAAPNPSDALSSLIAPGNFNSVQIMFNDTNPFNNVDPDPIPKLDSIITYIATLPTPLYVIVDLGSISYYENPDAVATIVERVKSSPVLLTYSTGCGDGDIPTMKLLDPYHPVAEALSNWHLISPTIFAAQTASADIIISGPPYKMDHPPYVTFYNNTKPPIPLYNQLLNALYFLDLYRYQHYPKQPIWQSIPEELFPNSTEDHYSLLPYLALLTQHSSTAVIFPLPFRPAFPADQVPALTTAIDFLTNKTTGYIAGFNRQPEVLDVFVDVVGSSFNDDKLAELVSGRFWVHGDHVLIIVVWMGNASIDAGDKGAGVNIQLPGVVGAEADGRGWEVLYEGTLGTGGQGWNLRGGSSRGGNILNRKGFEVGDVLLAIGTLAGS
jgi:hypothetical protein